MNNPTPSVHGPAAACPIPVRPAARARRFRSLTLGLAFAVTASLASAATYYVDAVNGNDLAAGTSEGTAWKSIQKINTGSFAPGDAVRFSRGTGQVWREQLNFPSNGTAAQPIAIGTYGSGSYPIISGANVVSGWSVYGDPANKIYQAAVPTQPFLFTKDHVWKRKGTGADTLVDGQWFWSAGVLYYRDLAANPANSGSLYEAGARSHGIFLYNRSHIVIGGLTFEKSNGAAAALKFASDISFSWCTFRLSNNKSTVHAYNAAGLSLYDAANVTVSNSSFQKLYGDGIFSYGAPGVIIENNTFTAVFEGNSAGSDAIHLSDDDNVLNGDNFVIRNNNITMQGTDSPKGGIIVERIAHGIISGNICDHGNFGINVASDHVLVENNVCRYQGIESGQTWAGGLFITGGVARAFDDITFRNNLVYGAMNGFVAFGSYARTNLSIHDNTFAGSLRSGALITCPTTGQFKNNLLWSTTTTSGVPIYEAGNVIAGGTWHTDHNLFGQAASALVRYAGVTYNTLAAYQATGRDLNSISADPLFVNASAGNYQLAAGSPAIDAGANTGVTADIDGIAIYGATDIGCYEVAAPPAPPEPVRVAAHNGVNASGDWLADSVIVSGSSLGSGSTSNAIDLTGVTDPAPAAIYQTHRHGKPFAYTLTGLAPGLAHTVRLHFCETWATGPNVRRFHVNINGTRVLTDLDVFQITGARFRAHVETFTATADANGMIVVDFLTGSKNRPFVSGIELFR